MWCSTCQQDVPGLGSPSSGQLHCGKCGTAMPCADATSTPPANTACKPTSTGIATPAENAALERLLVSGKLSEDDWTLEAELRGVQRLLTSLKSRPSCPAASHSGQPPHARPHSHRLQIPAAETSVGPPPPTATLSAHPPRSQVLAWTILSIGIAIFACGAVLLGWSLVAGRDELWSVGLPLALVGQAALVIGLILQLDGLWHSSRKTAQVLSELDDELKTVRQATTLLTTTNSQGAQSFYLHLAEGASPQLLLADLKGQMDVLAQQMAQRRIP